MVRDTAIVVSAVLIASLVTVGPLLAMRWITNRWFRQFRAIGGDSEVPSAECIEKARRLSWILMAIGMFLCGLMTGFWIWIVAFVTDHGPGSSQPVGTTGGWSETLFLTSFVGSFPAIQGMMFVALTKMMLHRLKASYRIWPKPFAVTMSEADTTRRSNCDLPGCG